MKCYIYSKCSTCRDALKWLNENQISIEKIEIRATPPSVSELSYAVEILGDIRKILNTSGQEYRAMGLKEKIDSMNHSEIFSLIQQNGNLCKRPFLIDHARSIVCCGFKTEEWKSLLQ